VSTALVIQHEKCMCRIILSPAVCLALPFFPPFSQKWHIFLERIIKCVFIYKFFCIISHSQKHWVRYTHAFMWSTSYSFKLLIELEFSCQIFGNSSNIKFHEIPSSGIWVVPCGQAATMMLVAAFCNFANAPKNGQ